MSLGNKGFILLLMALNLLLFPAIFKSVKIWCVLNEGDVWSLFLLFIVFPFFITPHSGRDFWLDIKKKAASPVKWKCISQTRLLLFFFFVLLPWLLFLPCRNYTSFFNSAVKVTQSFKQQFRQIDVYAITAANEMCLTAFLRQHKAASSIDDIGDILESNIKKGTVVITW